MAMATAFTLCEEPPEARMASALVLDARMSCCTAQSGAHRINSLALILRMLAGGDVGLKL